jgi:multidrug efflux system membrane fusion protein
MENQVVTEPSPDQELAVDDRRRGPCAKPSQWPLRATLLAAALAVGLYFWNHSPGRPQPLVTAAAIPQAVIIRAAEARAGNMGMYVHALGTVTPVSTVTIYSQLSGQVIAVHYSEGQMINKADPLVDIDPRGYEAQLQQAEGLLDRDRGILQQARMNLERYQQAYAKHAVAKQILDDQDQLVTQYEGVVKNDMGQVSYAQVQLSYCHIVAPVSGRVGLRLVDTGNTIFAGTTSPLAVLTQLQPITAVFNVAEDHLMEIQRELRLRQSLAVDAFDRSNQTKIASGTLLTTDNQIDTATGTLRFRAEFDNKNLTLFPNQFINARLLLRTLKNAVLVPSATIQHNGDRAFVYRVAEGRVTLRSVKERATEGDISAVEGLQPGEWFAQSGFDRLQEGAVVEIEQQPSTAGKGQEE